MAWRGQGNNKTWMILAGWNFGARILLFDIEQNVLRGRSRSFPELHTEADTILFPLFPQNLTK
jgi:hypothetical protein